MRWFVAFNVYVFMSVSIALRCCLLQHQQQAKKQHTETGREKRENKHRTEHMSPSKHLHTIIMAFSSLFYCVCTTYIHTVNYKTQSIVIHPVLCYCIVAVPINSFAQALLCYCCSAVVCFDTQPKTANRERIHSTIIIFFFKWKRDTLLF